MTVATRPRRDAPVGGLVLATPTEVAESVNADDIAPEWSRESLWPGAHVAAKMDNTFTGISGGRERSGRKFGQSLRRVRPHRLRCPRPAVPSACCHPHV